MDAVAESRRKERSPEVRTRLKLGMKNDGTDAGGIERSNLLFLETKFSGVDGERKEYYCTYFLLS